MTVQWEANCGHCQACDTHHMPAPDPNVWFVPSSLNYCVCAECGNKRCPHATDHRLACTGSNDPNQPGSSYQQRYFGDEPGTPA